MAATTARPTIDAVEGAPRSAAAHRQHRLAATISRRPATPAEAVEVADLLQALTPDCDDPMHRAFADAFGAWLPVVPGWKLAGDTGKLVRDGIPGIIRRKGLVPLTLRCADTGARWRRLLDKVVEERNELAAHVTTEGTGDLGELADLLEVVETMAALTGYTLDEVRAAQAEKREERGGFDAGLIWFGNVPPSQPPSSVTS